MRKLLFLLLFPIVVKSQHALTNRNELSPFIPENFAVCHSCCNVNNGLPHKAVIENYDNNHDISGTPENVTIPASNYYLLWEDDGNQLDTIWSRHDKGNIFRKKDINGSWYFPKWMVNIEASGIAGGGKSIQAYIPDNLHSQNGESQIWLTRDEVENYFSSCLYKNGKQKYGYWEARLKITDVKKGTFPTFWLFNPCNEQNPGTYAEIDICDFPLKNNNRYGISSWESQSSGKCECCNVYGTEIRPTMKVGNAYKNIDFSADYFIYGVDWRPDSVIFYLNRNRILSTINIVNNSPVSTILELKVKENWNPLSNPQNTLIYHIDWVKYYKRKEDMDKILAPLPTQVCIGTEQSCVLNDFFEGAYFTCKGANNSYTSPIIVAENQIPTTFPNDIPCIYPTIDFSGRTAWNVFLNLKIPQTCPIGKYLITMHLPNVAEEYCPKKEIVVIDTLPQMPIDIVTKIKGSNTIDYKCIIDVEPQHSNLTYKWNIDSVSINPTIIIKNGGDYNISVASQNSCGLSEPYTEMIHCPMPISCENCEENPFFLYPNPNVSGSFIVESTKAVYKIELYDTNAKRVFTLEKAPHFEWDISISPLNQGFYQVVLYTEKDVFYTKLIISK